MDYKCVLYRKEGAVGWIVLNRPDNLNALNTILGEEARLALEECERDEEVRVVVITGAGRAFCAGTKPTVSLQFGRKSISQQANLSQERSEPPCRTLH